MIQAQSADGVIHQFPDDTKPAVVDRVMKQYAEGIKLKKGSFTGASMDTFATDILGSPGDLESLVRAPIASLASKLGVSPRYAADIAKPLLPTSSSLLKSSGGNAEVAAHPIGALTGHALAAAPIAGAGVEGLANEARRALSAKRAISAVSDVGKTADFGELGSDMLKAVRPDYTDLYAERAKALENAAPAEHYVGATDEGRAALNTARKNVYRDPRFAGIGKFEADVKDSVIGQKLLKRTGRFSTAFKLDPADLPNAVFDSRASVQDFRRLLARSVPDADAVLDHFAGDYAGRSLMEKTANKSASTALSAAEKWRMANEGWLKETPLTKAAVDRFISKLGQVAKARGAIGTAWRFVRWPLIFGLLGEGLWGLGGRDIARHL